MKIKKIDYSMQKMCLKDADGMANRVDRDSLIWLCTVCSYDLSVPIFKILMVFKILAMHYS